MTTTGRAEARLPGITVPSDTLGSIAGASPYAIRKGFHDVGVEDNAILIFSETDDGGQGLVPDPAFLQPARAVLRQVLPPREIESQ